MLKSHWLEFQILLLAIEIMTSAAIFGVLTYSPSVVPGAEFDAMALLALGFLACSAWPLVLHSLNLYSSQRLKAFASVLVRLAAAGMACTVLVAAAAFLLSAPVDSSFPFVFGATQFAILSLLRLTIHGALRWMRRSGRNFRNILIVGSGPRAAHIRNLVERQPSWALRIVGFVDDHEYSGGDIESLGEVHKFADLPELFRENVIDEVVVALPRSLLSQLGPVVEACTMVGVSLTIPVDFFEDFMPPPRITRFGSTAALSYAPVYHSPYKLAVKRVIDVVGASLALLAAAPVMAVAIVVIKATSKGPAFFCQARCGLHGREFFMYKLRTMVCDADEQKAALAHLNESDGPVFKIRNDPRVTAVGGFLRRWSLDEFPQFWNVLKGEMSLVGPRPPVPAEVSHYRTCERRRLSMRPGITCFWQIQGRNQICFADWVKLDVQYIETWSLAQDFRILSKTLPAVLNRTGAS